MKAIRMHSYLLGIIFSFEVFVSRAAIFISILGYVLLGIYVTAERIFAITAIYNSMRPVITILFSISLTSIAEVNVSIIRLQEIMSYEEKDPLPIEDKKKKGFIKEEDGHFDALSLKKGELLLISKLILFHE